MDMKTTTFPDRHTRLLRAAAEEDRRSDRVRVLEVGPGLVLRRPAMKAQLGTPLRRIARYPENLLRRLPFPDSWYESYETWEIVDAFDPQRTGRALVTVVDINPKPLRIVQRMHGDSVTCIRADIAGDLRDIAPSGFDVVIALAVVGRIPPTLRPRAKKNLVGLTSPGGLIATTADATFDEDGVHVERLGFPGLYRRLR
jgi:hypothetical protein